MRTVLALVCAIGAAPVVLVSCGADEAPAAAVGAVPSPAVDLASQQARSLIDAARATFGAAVAGEAAVGFQERDGALIPRWPSGAIPEVEVELPTRAGGSWSLRDEKTRVAIEVTLMGARDRSVVASGGWAVYPGALDEADVLHRPRADGTEDLIVFARRPAEPVVDYRLSLGMAVAGLRLVGGVLEVLDAGGAPRLRVSAPRLVDARRHVHPLRLAVTGCSVDADPAPPWGRATTAPGAGPCRLSVRWDDAAVIYPALVDPLWTNVSQLAVAHSRHTATALADGRILVAGGVTTDLSVTADAEVFDPATSTWAMVDPMPQARSSHTATLLTGASVLEGQVLVAGGRVAASTSPTCLLFDPGSGTWSPASPMATARDVHVAALTQGKVLAAGGNSGGGVNALASAEIFDPATGAWTPTGSLQVARIGAAASTLPALGERVLVSGGVPLQYITTPTAEIFDPATLQFTTTAEMSIGRAYFPVARLADGRVIAAGGMTDYGPTVGDTTATTSVDVYDPVSGFWTAGPAMSVERYQHTITVLKSGGLLVTGGKMADNTVLASAALLDSGLSAWTETDPVPQARFSQTASPLADGAVLVVGGENKDDALATAHRYGGYPDGQPCTLGSDCTSGLCVDDVCCDTPCDDACNACTAALKGEGEDGTCGPVPSGTDPGADCADQGSPTCQQNGDCDGAGACQLYPEGSGCVPEPCDGSEQCASGFCTDGICCDSACDDNCESCLGTQTAGQDGHCAPVVAGTDPDDECGDDGSGSTDCSKILLCDGAGSCAPSNELCGPYTCLDASGCKSSCTVDADCLPTHRCEEGLCVLRAARCEGTVLMNADGIAEDCAPYACDANGPACKTGCESASDCAPGFVCTGSGACADTPTAPAPDDGCGCRVPGEPARGSVPGGVLVLAALAALGIRRSRSRHV